VYVRICVYIRTHTTAQSSALHHQFQFKSPLTDSLYKWFYISFYVALYGPGYGYGYGYCHGYGYGSDSEYGYISTAAAKAIAAGFEK